VGCHRGAVLIYKILLPAEWSAFEAAGRFDGSPFDHSSGFVHCSSREQVAATAMRVFGRESALVVLALDTGSLDAPVRWEQAAHGGSYPHVYGSLTLDAVVRVYRVDGPRAVAGALAADEP
jgi:uncharacterized protein (DUF952 family)